MEQGTPSKDDQLILAIKEEQILVAPESKIDIHIGIVNQSPNEDYFDIQVEGVPPEWITIDTPVVHVAAERQNKSFLRLRHLFFHKAALVNILWMCAPSASVIQNILP